MIGNRPGRQGSTLLELLAVIAITNQVQVGSAMVPGSVAVWSVGRDHIGFTADDVVSWE